MKTTLRQKLSTFILHAALLLILLLAIPLCLFLLPISVIWTLAEAAIRRLEP